jgi:UDP-glucose 4-epimerase
MKRVFITGGAGFIGSHLSEYLLSLGYEVTIVDDLSTGSLSNIEHIQDNPKFHYVIDSIFNDALMKKLIEENDLIFHLAAAVGVKVIMENPIEAMEINAMGTKNILKQVSCFDGKKVIVASTSEVYGKGVTVPFSEGDDLLMGPTSKGRWSYACAKMMDEFLTLAYCKEYGMEAIVVRFFNTVGPRQSSHYGMVLPRFVKQALNNEDVTVYSDGTQTRCFTHVMDVVWALEKLVNSDKAVGEVVNIGNPEEISIINLAKKIIKVTNSKSDIFHIPYDQVYNQDFEDMKRRIPNIAKINGLIGYKPQYNLVDIINQIIQYFKALQGEASEAVKVDFKKSKKKKAA